MLRLADQRPDAVVAVLDRLLHDHDLAAMSGCLVVVTETLVRLRRD